MRPLWWLIAIKQYYATRLIEENKKVLEDGYNFFIARAVKLSCCHALDVVHDHDLLYPRFAV